MNVLVNKVYKVTKFIKLRIKKLYGLYELFTL